MSVVTSGDQLKYLVDDFLELDEFVFDVETIYTPTADEAERFEFISAQRADDRSAEDAAWLDYFKYRPTDPAVNEVIWIGIASYGRGHSIATGHPHGSTIKPQRREKVSVLDIYSEGDERRYTKTGKLSKRHVERTLPAVFSPPPPQLDIVDALDIMKPLFFHPTIRKVNQNVGFDLLSIAKYFDGGEIPGPPYGELAVALHILNENAFKEWSLANFVTAILGHSYDKLGAKGVHNFGFEEAARYAQQDARFTWLLWKKAQAKLQADPVLWELFLFEMDLMMPLRRQEQRGAFIDNERRLQLKHRYEEQLRDIRDRIIVDYGAPTNFNMNSGPQKQKLLYEVHGAHIYKLTKGQQASVDADSLESIVQDGDTAGEIAQLMLDHAAAAKMYGTYIIGIGARLDRNGLLHPSFSQNATVTGRLSCREPNIQNIPRESDLREMFIPPPGYVLIDVDYDQVELRFIAYFSRDPELCRIFNDPDGEDIHTATARGIMKVLGIDHEGKLTVEERTIYGKTPNFLMGFGGSKYKLAASTGVTPDEGQLIIDGYWTLFNGFAHWKNAVVRNALKRTVRNAQGKVVVPPYVTTIMGRRRRLPNLLLNPSAVPYGQKEEWKRVKGMVAAAERQAVNARVQGSAADAIKTAMIDIDDYCLTTKFPLQMIMNVHDEIVAICPEKHAEEGKALVEEKMAGVINRRTGAPFLEDRVPLVASGKILDRWAK